MPHIEAFRGVRYDLGHVGALSDVVAPPYDVIDADLKSRLEAASPHNVVRLILGADQPGDDDNENRYTRSAKTMREWRRDGVLFEEGDPAVYVYHQVYNVGDTEFTRRGFMCRVRIEPFGTGQVFPHEETHGGAKADRLRMWRACRANLSQIFGLFPDPENQAQAVLDPAVAGAAPLESTDHLGVVNRIWPVTDVAVISALQKALGGRPVYIADGHHRYETACAYREEVAAQYAEQHGGAELPSDHPANYVLMMCVSMSDPGMLVLPTHRLFRGMPELTAEELAAKLGESFTTESIGEGRGRRAAGVGADRAGRRPGNARALHREGPPLDPLPRDRRRPQTDGRDRARPFRRLAGPGREPAAPAGGRRPVRLPKRAGTQVPACDRGGRARTRTRRRHRARPHRTGRQRRAVRTRRDCHARVDRRHPPCVEPRRAHAGQRAPSSTRRCSAGW